MSALEGIKVIDLSRYIAGPYCAKLLGDFGAEVLKVETPEGDFSRRPTPQVEGENLCFMVMNRNKKGITLNTRTEEGKKILTRLFRDADIIVQNYRVGTMEKMGFSWERLQEINPKLILVSISGYGPKGPMAMYPGYDALVQALGGMMDRTGEPDGPPYLSGTFMIDYGTGTYAALGAVAALQAREVTGKGQQVELSLLQTALSFQVDNIPWYYTQGKWRGRIGNNDPSVTPSGAYLSKDNKYILIQTGVDGFWEKFMCLIGKAEYVGDPRFKTTGQRIEHRQLFEDLAQEWAAQYDRDEIMRILGEEDIPAAPVLTLPEVVELPQVKENDMIINVPYTGLAPIPQQGFVMNMSKTPMAIRSGAPRLGEHNEEVLLKLGYSAAEIKNFKESGII